MTYVSERVGVLAKVTAISDDGYRVYFDFRNGSTGSIDNVDEELAVGDVLLITQDKEDSRYEYEGVPSSAWPEANWVGIVRLKLQDISVIETGGRLRTVPTVSTPCYQNGYTVLAGDVQGVTRVLSERPIKYLDLPEVDDSVIDRFLLSSEDTEDLGFEHFGGLSTVVARARELIEIPSAMLIEGMKGWSRKAL